MTTFASNRVLGPTYRYNYLTGAPAGGTQYLYPVSQVYSARSPTIKRPRPRNLSLMSGTPLTVESFEYEHSSGTRWVGGEYFEVTPVSQFFEGNRSAPPLGEPYADFSIVDGKLRGRIKNSNLNLAQSLAEYRTTSKMVSELLIDSVKFFRSLRSGTGFGELVRVIQRNPKQVKQLKSAVANRWLQYQYGIKPLMSDIYGSAEALAVGIRDGITMYASATHSGSSSATILGSTRGENPNRSNTRNWSQRAMCSYIIRDKGLKTLSQIGVTNPALLAWELIPYSFVFDWIVPVGNFLSSLDALVGVENLIVQRSFAYRGAATAWSEFGTSTEKYVVKQRLAPTDDLSLPPLGYQPSTSLMAVTNGLALLAQLRK